MFSAKQIENKRYKLVARSFNTKDGLKWNYEVVDIILNITIETIIIGSPFTFKEVDVTHMQKYVDELNIGDQSYLHEIFKYVNNK